MQLLSQRDKRWSWKPIGDTTSTIGRWGCTITAISMLSDYFKCFNDPAWMAKNLRFTSEAKIIWKSVTEKLCFQFVYRYYKNDKDAFNQALKDPKMACILEEKSRHWVTALRRLPMGYWVADPWTGSKRILFDSAVSGGATFKKG